MLKSRRFMVGTLLWAGSMMINHANADTLQPCSCWTNGNSRADGSKCFAKAQIQATTWETFISWFWLPEVCRSWCSAAREQEKIDTYNFPYTDWTSLSSCDDDAIYDRDKFINTIVRENSSFAKNVKDKKIKTYLKSHPTPSQPLSPSPSKPAKK